MEAARWQQAKQIFDEALDSPVPSRRAFVAKACGGDAELQRLVEDLLGADDAAGSFLDTGWLKPASPTPPESYFAPGDVISGRYRIVRTLGGGGMGQVYEAVDAELNVRVALKTIRPEISSNPEVLFRFRQEVRLAHRITHPNVCRTFHLDREVRESSTSANGRVEISFLTMEYLRGETLRSLLKEKGRIAPPRALAIARQIAAALHAAHRAGIVHRDIKPANIMIVPADRAAHAGVGYEEERVVVTDFGLARWQAADPEASLSQHSISAAGHAIGTLAYMAPEQLHGGVAGPSTDIYAFGLVLYEMVTGERFFSEARTPLVLGWGNGEAPSALRELAHCLGPEWATAISGCLQADPALRFQSADEVIATLEGPVPPSLKAAAARPRRRLMVLALALSAAVALFAAGLRLYKGRADAKLPEGALVYLAPVRNETGEKQLNDLTELVHGGLAQSARISLLDDAKAAGILQQMTRPAASEITPAVAREIAMRAGAVRVVFATVSGSGGKYHLNFDIQRPDMTPASFRDHWQHTVEWIAPPASSRTSSSASAISPDLLRAIREGSDWVRERVGESANDIARLDAPPEDVTTADWRALSLYANAEKLSSAQRHDEAIAALEEATRIDPGFALAYGRLGDILATTGRIQAAFKAYQQALAIGSEERLSLRERDRIKGYYALDSWNYEGAVAAFRDYATYYDKDYGAYTYLGYALEEAGQPKQAIAAMKKAYALDPARSPAPDHLAEFHLEVGDIAESRRWNEVFRHTPSNGNFDYIAGIQSLFEADYSSARRSFEGLTRSQQSLQRDLGYAMLARLDAEQGRPDDAFATAAAALAEDIAAGNRGQQAARLLDRAALHCAAARFQNCAETVRQAFDLDSSPQLYFPAALVLGRAHRKAAGADARLLLDELMRLEREGPAKDGTIISDVLHLHLRGEILLAKGDAAKALAIFRQAAAIEPPGETREPLARALIAVADHQADPRQGAILRGMALDAYKNELIPAGLRWRQAWTLPPGFVAEALQEYIELAATAGKQDGPIATARDLLSSLRKENQHSSPSNRAQARHSKNAA